jgi:hypothetical protein
MIKRNNAQNSNPQRLEYIVTTDSSILNQPIDKEVLRTMCEQLNYNGIGNAGRVINAIRRHYNSYGKKGMPTNAQALGLYEESLKMRSKRGFWNSSLKNYSERTLEVLETYLTVKDVLISKE